MNHITHIQYRWYKEVWNSLGIKMYDIKFAKEPLSLRIYNSSVPYRSNVLSYWLFISVYHLKSFFMKLKIEETVNSDILFLSTIWCYKMDHSDTHPKEHIQKTISFTSYQWIVLPVYKMEGSTFIGDWI